MKHLLLALTFLVCLSAPAQTQWLTVMGDHADPAVDTIDVNPVPLSVQGDQRTMSIRVSRSAQRASWEGIPYRSYNATVVIDCKAEKAIYLALDYFRAPFWQGKPYKSMGYTRETGKPMLFVDVNPNPTGRIIKAACF